MCILKRRICEPIRLDTKTSSQHYHWFKTHERTYRSASGRFFFEAGLHEAYSFCIQTSASWWQQWKSTTEAMHISFPCSLTLFSSLCSRVKSLRSLQDHVAVFPSTDAVQDFLLPQKRFGFTSTACIMFASYSYLSNIVTSLLFYGDNQASRKCRFCV